MIYIPEKEEIIKKKKWTTDYSRAFFNNQKENGDKLLVFGSGLSWHGFIVKDQNLYGFGSNDNSQLGVEKPGNATQLTLIPFFDQSNKITKVSCGFNHSVFLSKNEVYSCGRNNYGQLGESNGRSDNTVTPSLLRITQNSLLNEKKVDFLDVSVGYYHSHVLSTLLEVYSFGKNTYGQLGVGDKKYRKTVTKTVFSERIISITCGGEHSCFLSIEGNVYLTGFNGHGQYGDNTTISMSTPKKLLFFKKKKIMQICCGNYHTFYLTSDNQVYGNGYNIRGQLGAGKFKNNQKTPLLIFDVSLNNEKIIRVKCGGNHTCFESKKKIWLTGYNSFGQIGNGNVGSVNSPVLFSIKGKKIIQSLMMHSSSIHFTKNEVYGAGSNNYGELFCGKTNDKNVTPFKIRDLEVQKRKICINLNEIKERFEFLVRENKKFALYFIKSD